MLLFPAFKQYEDVTVFQDNMQFWKFYVLPGFPTVRLDKDNNPVFLLIKYLISDESRQLDPTLPRGGGYLSFDSELRVSDERKAKIAEDLQPYVKSQYETLKASAGQAKTVGFKGTFHDVGSTSVNENLAVPTDPTGGLPQSVPSVIFGEPLWKSGKVHLNAPSAPGLVRSKIADQPASMLGNEVAAFSMDLTEDGASFMQQTLVGKDGTGATDLTPIQVVYELTMTVALPPATMFVRIDMMNVYRSVDTMVHNHYDNGCDPDTYTTFQSKLQVAIDAGYVDIKIDAGGVTDEEVVKQLQTQAQALVTQILSDRFVAKNDSGDGTGGAAAAAGGGGSSGGSGGSGDSKPDDGSKSDANIYRFKQETEISLTNIEETYHIGGNADITIAPQGTLETFLAGAKNMSQFVRTVDLNDPFFMTLGLNVRAYANWDTDDIDFVTAEVSYPANDPNPKVQSFTFSGTSKDPQKWDPSLVNKARNYRFHTQVKFKGRDPGPWSDWQTETARDLNIGVATPGKLDLQIVSAGIDWDQTVALALVYLHYEDPANGVAAIEKTCILNDKHPADTWTELLYTPTVLPYQYRIDYILKPSGILSTNATSTSSQVVPVPDPSANRLLVTLLPDGIWDDVAHCAVTVNYTDAGNTYHVDQQFDLKSTDFRQWKVVLKDLNSLDFTVQWVTTFKSGIPNEQVGPLKFKGSQVVPLTVSVPYLKVALSAPSVDWTQIQLIQVDLDHPDGTTSVQLSSTHATDNWLLLLKDAKNKTYGYTVTYYPVKGLGDPVKMARATSTTSLLNIDHYEVPRVGADVIAALVDFTATPVVLVEFKYQTQGETLSFTDKTAQRWFIPVPAGAPREYQYQVSYAVLNKDGTTQIVAATPITTTEDKIVLMKYKAT